MSVLSFQRAAAALMVAAILPLAIGVALFFGRNGVIEGQPRSPAHYVWERGSITAAVVLTGIGLVLLEAVLKETNGHTLARPGAAAFYFGAVILVTAEAMPLPSGQVSYPLIVVYVVLALLGQTAIGGSPDAFGPAACLDRLDDDSLERGLVGRPANCYARGHLLPGTASPHAPAHRGGAVAEGLSSRTGDSA